MEQLQLAVCRPNLQKFAMGQHEEEEWGFEYDIQQTPVAFSYVTTLKFCQVLSGYKCQHLTQFCMQNTSVEVWGRRARHYQWELYVCVKINSLVPSLKLFLF